ncbi:MAG: c-type cytochrome [Vicinamibacterales bacterium]
MSKRAWIGSVTIIVTMGVTMGASQNAPAQGGGAGGGRRGAPPPAGTPPTRPQVASNPVVDTAAHDRGRALWSRECISCHGTQARGSDTGPNIIRSRTANFDRSAATAGSVLGPFLKSGHPTQSGTPSTSFTPGEVVDLANFLRQRVNDTMRSSATFTAGNVLVGDAAAGEAYFKGAGKCATCHTATRNLAGIATRIPAPVDLQQRMLFPSGGGRRGALSATPNPNAITATITPATGQAVSGVLVEQSDFHVTLRLADGSIRVVRRAPGVKVVITNPLQAHVDMLDVVSDKQIHDLVAYLETMK